MTTALNLQETINYNLELNNKIFIAFGGEQKVFHSISHTGLMEQLKKLGVSWTIYNNTQLILRWSFSTKGKRGFHPITRYGKDCKYLLPVTYKNIHEKVILPILLYHIWSNINQKCIYQLQVFQHFVSFYICQENQQLQNGIDSYSDLRRFKIAHVPYDKPHVLWPAPTS